MNETSVTSKKLHQLSTPFKVNLPQDVSKAVLHAGLNVCRAPGDSRFVTNSFLVCLSSHKQHLFHAPI